MKSITLAIAFLLSLSSAWARDPKVTVRGEVLDISDAGVLLETESGVIELPKKDFESQALRPGARYNVRLRISELRAAQRKPAAALKNKQRKKR